jgi:hypothetical protein
VDLIFSASTCSKRMRSCQRMVIVVLVKYHMVNFGTTFGAGMGSGIIPQL